MIEMYTGFVGSGKSYHATHEGLIVAESRTKKEVIANFPISKNENFLYKFNKKLPKFKNLRWNYVDNEDLTSDFLIKKSFDYEKENGDLPPEGHFLLIIDEAGINFNSRDW